MSLKRRALAPLAWLARHPARRAVALAAEPMTSRRRLGGITHRNGYRGRMWETRAGTLEPKIAKLRTGSHFPGVLESRRPAGKAPAALVREAYVHGVSMRSAGDPVQAPARPASARSLQDSDRSSPDDRWG